MRNEVTDMNEYLDSDSARRQANTILRLTVVTILGLIGTIATGLLGMNLIAAGEAPMGVRILIFLVTLAATVALTAVTVSQSKRLADVLDVISDSRIGWKGKWAAARSAWRSTCRPARLAGQSPLLSVRAGEMLPLQESSA